ncbi:MAG: hypothetical protein ACPG31_02310 [Planctomycetota bacterium]
MQRNLAFIFGLGLLCLAAFLFLSPPEADSLESGLSEPFVDADPSTPAPLVLDAPSPSKLQRSDASTSSAGSESEPPSKEEAPPTRRIQLLRGDSTTPVADAELWVFANSQLRSTDPAVLQFLREHPDPEERGRYFSETYRSDADGYVDFPMVESGAQVIARSGELFGIDPWFGRNTHILRLFPDQQTTVRILDHRGQPLAGIPVGISFYNDDDYGSIGSSAAFTNTDGYAEVRHLQRWLQPQFPRDIRIGPHLLLKEDLSIPLAAWRAGSHGDCITLPPLGSVTVVVQDYEEESVPGFLGIQLLKDPHPETRPQSFELESRRAPSLVTRGETVTSSYHFPHVGLGLELAVHVLGAPFNPDPVGFGPGPWTEGQTVELLAKPPSQESTYQMRLVDEDGRALAHQDLIVIMSIDGDASWRSDAYVTDKDGNFTFTPGEYEAEALHREGLGFRIRSSGDEHFLPKEGSLPPPPEPSGPHDFGEIRMSSAGILASGVVVDEDEEPIPSIWITATFTDGEEPEDDFLATDTDGRFTLFQKAPGKSVTLHFDHQDYLAQKIEVAAGTSDLRIQLKKGKVLSGNALFSDGIHPDDFSAKLLDKDGNTLGSASFRDDGTFSMKSLGSDTGTLAIRHSNQANTFLTIEGITPIAEGEAQDPRLTDIDLRGKVQKAQVLVLGRDQEPIERPRFQADGREGFLRFAFGGSDGVVHVLLGEESAMAAIYVPGYSIQEFEIVPGEQTLQLEGGWEATLQLSPKPVLPPGYHLFIQPWHLNTEGKIAGFASRARFDDTGRAQILVPSTGTFGAYIAVQNEKRFSERLPSWDHQYEDDTFEIHMQGATATGTLTVSQEEIDALISD